MNELIIGELLLIGFGALTIVWMLVMFTIYRLTGGKHSFLWYIDKL